MSLISPSIFKCIGKTKTALENILSRIFRHYTVGGPAYDVVAASPSHPGGVGGPNFGGTASEDDLFAGDMVTIANSWIKLQTSTLLRANHS